MVLASQHPLIATRASPEKKAKFSALAKSRGMSESALLTVLIDAVIGQNPVPEGATQDRAEDMTATHRLSLRLRPGDRELVDARAAERNMKTASYLVMLIRAHVRHAPPMPMAELNELKVAVGALSAVGRELDQLLRVVANGRESFDDSLPALLSDGKQQIEGVRRYVADVVRINLRSWEANDA